MGFVYYWFSDAFERPMVRRVEAGGGGQNKKIKKIKKKLWPKNPRNPAFFLLTWGKNETFLKLFSKNRLTFERFEHILCRLSS